MVSAIVIGCALKENLLKAKAHEESSEFIVNEISEDELQSVETQILEDGSVKSVVIRTDGIKVISLSKGDYITVYMYDKNGELISEEITDLSQVSEEISEEELENSLDLDYIDEEYDDENIMLKGSKTQWNKTVKETYKNNYWYKKGNNGKKIYLKVGCNAKYKVRLDTLSSSKLKICNKYMNAIKDTRQKMKTAKTILIGAGIATALVTSIVATTLALVQAGVKAITTIVAKIKASGILGQIVLGAPIVAALTTSVGSVLGASRIYEDIKDYYVDVRSYGKKYK